MSSTKRRPKVKYDSRLAKQFGKACGEFNLLDGKDKILIPFDLSVPTICLGALLARKASKMPVHFTLVPIHLFSSPEPNPNTKAALDEIVHTFGISDEVTYRCVEQPDDQLALTKLFVSLAQELSCNKVALPDSLDYMDAVILKNMCVNGIFDGPAAHQVSKTESEEPIAIIRPMTYTRDHEIAKFGKDNEIESAPTGISISEDDAITICREALEMFPVDPSTNTYMNFFHSQFAVQRKYVGGSVEDEVM